MTKLIFKMFKRVFAGPYISEWNASLQKEIYGTAWGMNTTTNEPVPVGSMEMQQGMPYFISPDAEGVVRVGELPEHVTFELKRVELGGGLYSAENYIVLPLNTRIKKASDLCKEIPMGNYDWIAYWDTLNQEEKWSDYQCLYIKLGVGDFDLYPGQVYKITIDQTKPWPQV